MRTEIPCQRVSSLILVTYSVPRLRSDNKTDVCVDQGISITTARKCSMYNISTMCNPKAIEVD